MAVLGLRFYTRAFPSCGKRGPLFIAVHGPLTLVASLVAEHGLQTRRLSSCGSRAQSLRGMWDLPRPGLEPVSPALAGRFSTTAPPGKPQGNLAGNGESVTWKSHPWHEKFLWLPHFSVLGQVPEVRNLQPGFPLLWLGPWGQLTSLTHPSEVFSQT